MDGNLLQSLQTAYDQMVDAREKKLLHPWKLAERARVLAMIEAEAKHRLLEIGVGTGRDSLFFQQQGLAVTCTDLSPAMVARCQAKGLHAAVVPFAMLDQQFEPEAFDVVYAVNCLLHVPKADLRTILHKIRTILAPNGLFYWGQYGGVDVEGVWEEDNYTPKRFFSRYTDEQFRQLPADLFRVEAFTVLPKEDGNHFHSLLLRKA